MKLMKSLGVLGVVLVSLLVVTGASAEIRQDALGSGCYGYYGGCPNSNNGYGGSSYGIAPYPQPYNNSCGGSSYGIAPYPQPTQQYCMQWVQGRWVPVRVMVPGRWVYRPVWIPGYPITLYKPLPGYWRQTVSPAQPDLSVWQTPNGWYGSPYQGQAGGYGQTGGYGQAGGYFDSYGVWHSGR